MAKEWRRTCGEILLAIETLRRTGKFTGGGGFEAVVVQENKRPNSVREEFSLQGMTGINAYDGSTGWKIEPWQGKRDPEALSEEEMRQIVEDADFDGPLVNYKEKGNTVEFQGIEQIEGSHPVPDENSVRAGRRRSGCSRRCRQNSAPSSPTSWPRRWRTWASRTR